MANLPIKENVMFEKFKAKDALSHLGEDVDLTESALISRAKDSLLTNPEWSSLFRAATDRHTRLFVRP